MDIFKDDALKHLVSLNLLDNQDTIKPKSSIFSKFILQYIFDSIYTIDESLKLLERINNNEKSVLFLKDVKN